MIKDILENNPIVKQKFVNFMNNAGLSKSQYDAMINSEYYFIQQQNFDFYKFNIILQDLNDGFSLEEISSNLNNTKIIKDFIEALKANNLSLNEAIALKKYCEDSKIILKCSRNHNLADEYEAIIQNAVNHLQESNFSAEEIDYYLNYALNLDYSKPLYENYETTKTEFASLLPKSKIYSINSIIQNLYNFKNIDKVINDLQSALNRPLNQNTILYRAVKSNFLTGNFIDNIADIDKMQGEVIKDVGFTSTSTEYSTSFAKYKDYDVVLEIYAPKGTTGMNVSPFSDYGDVENEILLNSNEMFVFDVKNDILDENNNKKCLLRCLAISDDKTFYNEMSRENSMEMQR